MTVDPVARGLGARALALQGIVVSQSTDLQSAIDAAPDGARLIVEGDRTVSSQILISGRSNLEIVGARGAALRTTGDFNVLRIQQSSGVTVEGIRFVGDADAGKSLQTAIAVMNGCSDIRVLRNRIEDMGYDGVHFLYGVEGYLVAENVVINCQDDGINPGGGGGVTGSSRGIVVNNFVEGSGYDGIHVSDLTTQTTVIGNTVKDCGRAGIGLYGTTNFTIEGNTISGCALGIGTVGGATIFTDFTISANVISNCPVGIKIERNAARFAILGNSISGATGASSRGIEVTKSGYAAGGEVEDFTVADNVISGGSATAQGIRMGEGARRYLVRGNVIKSALTYGIVASYATATPRYNADGTIEGNLIAGGCATAGVLISGASCVDVNQNTFIGVQGAGIRLAANTLSNDDVLVAYNKFRDVTGTHVDQPATVGTNITVIARH